MSQQRSFALTRELASAAIWERFYQSDQTEVIAIYAQLIARAVKVAASSEEKDKERTQHENSDR
jgi:hypothetical protein